LHGKDFALNGTPSPTGQATDNELVSRCLAGDNDAWTALLARYERLIYGIALNQGLNEGRAADVFQNVALILLQQLEQVRDIDRLAGWLATTTRREAWKEIRRSSVIAPDSELLLEQMPDDRRAVQEVVAQWEAFEALQAALDEVGGRCETLLRRLYLSEPEKQYQEVAAELGIPMGSIGPTRARCLQKLRDSMHLREWHTVR
jgi:RNA polymerase sigma factor (sigma-70 family)